MSWFGDSLNSLKGQITKITKEVLADDEASISVEQEPKNEYVKELENLCESKDVEIASLRDEFDKLHNQYKLQIEFLKADKIEVNKNICDTDNVEIQKLTSELVELRQERDYLNSCLEELQAEHQTNLNEVISSRNKYKSELETLKKNYNSVKAKLNELLSDSNTKETCQDNAISLLNSKIEELQQLLEKEKEKSLLDITKEQENQNNLKKELQKVLDDIQVINKDKEQIKEQRKIIQNENEQLKNKLMEKEQEVKECEIKLKLITNERDEHLRRCQEEQEVVEMKLSGLMKTEAEVKLKLKNFLQLLNVNAKEVINEDNIVEVLTLLEKKYLEKCREPAENLKESTNNLEKELLKLKEENKNFQNELKISIENSTEIEKKYQEEILSLRSSLSEMKTQEEDCINQSQTDDVKRLDQEIAQCMNVICMKNNEISDYLKTLNSLELELKNLKVSSQCIEEELFTTKEERKKLEEEIVNLKSFNSLLNQEKVVSEEKLKMLESEKENLNLQINQLQDKINGLEDRMVELISGSERLVTLEKEFEKVVISKSETEKKLEELQNENLNLKNEFEHLKAQNIIQESLLAELMKTNSHLQEEVNKLQAENNKMQNFEKELKKWKDASVDLQIQQEDLTVRKEELENECFKLKNELEVGLRAKDAEIQQLKMNNSNLMKSCNELHTQLETRIQAGQSFFVKENDSDEKYKEQREFILQLQEENNELKSRVQKFQEQMKMQMFQLERQQVNKEDIQQHRRSKSAVDTEALDLQKSGIHLNEDLTLLKQSLQQEQAKYQALHQQFIEISNKEVSFRKEFERLKQHLIEIEDHYTEEAVENEKIINDLKSKLVAAEEQLQNSSTLYTSLKVRDNQHLESLQNQVRMVSVQRDNLQAKLSAAEDEVQKHKASLMSLQIVLEQFQKDKEREIEEVSLRYEKQLQLKDDSFKVLETEIQSLKNQLTEAKNGLKAASRLGEQLEKKAHEMSRLEENLQIISRKSAELESNLAVANQANNGKVDKSLIKNLIVGYILSPNADRKSQVLRIIASVLDFNQDERNKMDVDANRSGWLSNILHPKGDGPPSSQSLSEAFIRFLENESRPQPQLKLLPDQLEAGPSKTSGTSPKPPGRISELMLPTFNSSQENESSIILKNVLKDS